MSNFYSGRFRFGKTRFSKFVLLGFGIALLAAAVFSLGHVKSVLNSSTSSPTERERTERSLPATAIDSARYGVGVQRTLRLLSSSTPEHRNTVRILFYGQSITKQNWWLDVADDFRQRFPNANLIFDNRAIGGFDSSKLVRTAEHDLYPFYPDLVIFHAFGKHGDYETIIGNVRRRTTAEIVLLSDHVTWLPTGTDADPSEELKTYKWHNEHSTQWLPKIAQKYGCELIEIRKPWEQYLRQQQLQAQTLLADKVHLNDRGSALMATLVKTHLHNLPKLTIDPATEAVKRYTVGRDVVLKDGKLTLPFDGNRVELVSTTQPSGNSGTARILIDGKTPSVIPNLYTITRPSDAFGTEWPSILTVTSEKAPVPEDWKVVITAVDPDVKQFKFEAFGSETGFDGSGESDRKFVSNSGRVVIEPQNWWLKTAYEYSKKPVPVGFQIQWRVEPLFADVYAPVANSVQESATIVAQNLSNATHTLEILPTAAKDLLVQEIYVYRPPLR